MFNLILNPMMIALSLSTATGVFVHDMKLDKAATVAFALPTAFAAFDTAAKLAHLAPDLHAHSERGSLTQAIHDLKSSNPRVQPRAHDDRKHLMQKHVSRGTHPYDAYYVPVV